MMADCEKWREAISDQSDEYDIAITSMEQLFDVVDADDIVNVWKKMK